MGQGYKRVIFLKVTEKRKAKGNYAVLFLLGVIVILLVMLVSQSKRGQFLPSQISRFAGFDSKTEQGSDVRLSAPVQLESDRVNPQAGSNVKAGMASGAGSEKATPSVDDFTRELNLRLQRPSTNPKLVYNWPCDNSKNASQHAKKVIVWQDSSVRWFRESFLASLDRAYEAGHQVVRHFKSHRIPANTLKETFDYIHEDACGYLPYPEIQGNVHIHRADDFNRRVVFEPWTRCALEKQCMCPRPPSTVIGCDSGTLHRCHRFDQSVMGIILSRLYQEDLWKIQFKELVFNEGKEFRVLRGDSKTGYFKG
ncbi:hypothetical protein PoB_004820700 [Plakobranchus ocellatus]|uniref:Glycosyltransferase family 92 protein n=1 Tax=Plakobranchus ocellatus TaxID=259542 RepID=A0AAV4BQT3_9GAST|nr:hypothetical protein PoB_004820700 [Plakobranchus ocellatus]